ncbi:MAG: aldo/keto reductase [Chloroflexi bacterium]|nr:aldo/keto reductase [Chloroflexota bacterium]
MQYRRLGTSGLEVSAIGLGGSSLGATVDGAAAVAVVRRALDRGITFVDTADFYGQGRSEELIGEATAGCRADLVLATKARHQMGESVYRRGLSRRWLMTAVEESLRRLRTDYIDLYQAHAPDAETPLEETLRTMDDLVRQGKVRYIGCSNFAAWELTYAVGISRQLGLTPWISIQQRWNLLEGLDDATLLPACARLGLGIIPYTPLASGILTGKYRRHEPPPPGTRLGDLERLRTRLNDPQLLAVDRLRSWAEARDRRVAELAIAWLLAFPQVGTVIVGARTPAQVDQNAAAHTWTLSEAEREEVAAVAAG